MYILKAVKVSYLIFNLYVRDVSCVPRLFY